MNRDEKALARVLFKNKIYESDGQKFEDIFTAIMNYTEPGFQSIKPWGNIGDKKNDGYIKKKGVFYQVFAPEDITKSYPAVVRKASEDFKGLIQHWNPINEYYFVVNDKYKGVNADSELSIQEIKKTYALKEAGFLTPKDLENYLFDLSDDQILTIVHFPDPKNITTLDYSILNEVIRFISQKPLNQLDDSLIIPDWDDKIIFNDLSGGLEEKYLQNGFFQLATLNKYLKNNSNFLSQELKDRVRSEYMILAKQFKGKELFWKLVNSLIPNHGNIYMTHVIVILSKYFETCDVFEEPNRC